MDPYASVADIYDLMIDWPARLARERSFFVRLFTRRPVHRALDVGCGTGHHARLFAELDAQTLGIDPSGPMIERARALTGGENPRFDAGGLADIPALPGTFDLIAVLGNTLSYVADAADLLRTVTSIREKLNVGGRFVAQVVNYDGLAADGERRLPMMHRMAGDREYLFLREYRMLNASADFTLITLMREDETWTQLVERSRHWPITGERMARALREAGFAAREFHGDFLGTPWDPAHSPALVITAQIG